MFDMDDWVAWDTETIPIGASNVVPPLVCSSFYGLQSKTEMLKHWSPIQEHSDYLKDMFETKNIIGHNLGGFDLAVAAGMDFTLMPVIWKALREGRVHCTMIREMLMNLSTTGHIDKSSERIDVRVGYSLADLVLNYLDIDISESKEEGAPRLLFDQVRDMELSDWPEEFRKYALEDARYTGQVFLMQEARRQRIIKERGFDPLKPEVTRLRVMSHFSLSLMTAQGVELDGSRVIEVTSTFKDLYNDPRLVEPLVEAGFVVPAQPPMPFKSGQIDHSIECRCHKENPHFIKSAQQRKELAQNCGCPPKMTKAKPEKGSDNAVFDYIWELAQRNDGIKVWAAPALITMLKDMGLYDTYVTGKVLNVKKVVAAELEKIRQEAAVFAEDPVNNKPPRDEAEAYRRPKGWGLVKDKDWLAEFAPMDPLLELFAERGAIAKIVTSYLPRLYWAEGYEQCPAFLEGELDRLSGKKPARRVHFGFSPLKETGRASSRGSTNGKQGKSQVFTYPSTNGQQVDPRIRPCHVAHGFLDAGTESPDLSTYTGNVIWSIDYSAMELATWAQTCYNLFGYSVMRDKINAGEDTHAFLGAQIACTMDPWFANACGGMNDRDSVAKLFFQMKGMEEVCPSEHFRPIFAEQLQRKQKEFHEPTFADYFGHYRTFAKPTGLGYPGGLGKVTFVVYAKGTYGVIVTLEESGILRQVWLDTYPEAAPYLEYVNKSKDPFVAPDYVEVDGKVRERHWLSYSSPLGMRRAHCTYTACANGLGLQTPGAEGALLGVCDVMEACTTGPLAGRVFPWDFVHDEQLGETKWDWVQTTRDIQTMQRMMEKNMEIVTPDVKAGTEACLMFRWDKKAEPVWQEHDGEKVLVPWVPKEEK